METLCLFEQISLAVPGIITLDLCTLQWPLLNVLIDIDSPTAEVMIDPRDNLLDRYGKPVFGQHHLQVAAAVFAGLVFSKLTTGGDTSD